MGACVSDIAGSRSGDVCVDGSIASLLWHVASYGCMLWRFGLCFPSAGLGPLSSLFFFLRLSLSAMSGCLSFDPVVVHVLTYGRCAFDEKLSMFSKIPFDEGAMVLWVAGLVWASGFMGMRWMRCGTCAEVRNMNICISHPYIYVNCHAISSR